MRDTSLLSDSRETENLARHSWKLVVGRCLFKYRRGKVGDDKIDRVDRVLQGTKKRASLEIFDENSVIEVSALAAKYKNLFAHTGRLKI